MEWIKILTELVGHLAWPAVLVLLAIMFRREIRQRFAAVTEVKYPGGSIVMREVERLEAKVQDVVGTSPTWQPGGRSPTSLQAPHSDSRLAIAQLRLDVEKELFLLSRHALNRADVTGWSVKRYIEELEKGKVLEPAFADRLREVVSIANQMVHNSNVPGDVVQRAVAVGSPLVATLHFKRLVLEAERDFDAHGLWHIHRKCLEGDNKHHFWSAVAASLPDFDYNYDVYREAAERHNKKYSSDRRSAHQIYVLSLEEFVTVLEFRESELLRIIRLWRADGWDSAGDATKWQWPLEWGSIEWTGPILRERVHLWGAEEDLMRTRAALAIYRARILVSRRFESASGSEKGERA